MRRHLHLLAHRHHCGRAAIMRSLQSLRCAKIRRSASGVLDMHVQQQYFCVWSVSQTIGSICRRPNIVRIVTTGRVLEDFLWCSSIILLISEHRTREVSIQSHSARYFGSFRLDAVRRVCTPSIIHTPHVRVISHAKEHSFVLLVPL